MKLEQHDVTLDPTRRPSAGNLIQQLYAAVCQEMLMFNPPAHAPSPYGVFLDGIPSSRHSGRLSRVSGFAGLGETHLVMMCVEMQGWNLL